jgi:hypothetical protein
MDSTRIGLFTSSQIHNLMTVGVDRVSFGKPARAYIRNKIRETALGIELDLEKSTHELSWGRAVEGYCYDTHIELDYNIKSDKTIVHPSKMFCGTPDLESASCVADIKCPYTRNSFCDLVEIIESGSVEVFKKQNDEYYFQLVSNSILTNKDEAELIVFMPYAKEIPQIVEYIEVIDDFALQMDIQWVIHTDIKRIPHIPDNSKYRNLYRFRFKVPNEDKDLLMENIHKADKLKNGK